MNTEDVLKQIEKNNKSRRRKSCDRENCSVQLLESAEGHILNENGDISLIIVYGKYNIRLDEKDVKLVTGNIVLLKQGYKIKYNTEEDNSKICIINFHKKFFDTHLISQMADCPILYDFIRLDTKSLEYLVFDISVQEIVKNYLNILLYEVSNLNEKSDKLVKAALILFLTNLHHDHQKSLVISESSMMKDYDIGKWLRYMADNYSTVTLTSMAEHFNFHPTYFSVRFKALANCQFSEKLLEIKLEKAKWLLITTNISVQNIVDMIGFKEKSYFYRAFKKRYGITPLQYRKQSNRMRLKEY